MTKNLSNTIACVKTKEATSSKPVKRKTLPKGDYETLFMQMNVLKDRKAVYISRDLQQEVARFIGTIKGGELSVGAYLENIIISHLELYRNEMDALYENHFNKPSKRFTK